MNSKEALEELYRKDCCVQTPNPSCGECKLGANSKCKLYEYYMQLRSDQDRLEKLEKVIEFLKPHTHLASGLCEIKLVDEEVSKVTPKYHNGKEVYEPKYNEFYKLFKEVLENA